MVGPRFRVAANAVAPHYPMCGRRSGAGPVTTGLAELPHGTAFAAALIGAPAAGADVPLGHVNGHAPVGARYSFGRFEVPHTRAGRPV